MEVDDRDFRLVDGAAAIFFIRRFNDLTFQRITRRYPVLELGSVPLPLSPRGSTVSLPKAAKALTRIWSEQAALADGADAGSSTSQPEETGSACVSMVALVGPNRSSSRRS